MNKMQKKVLLVDDEPDYLKIIKRRLEANNYQVTTATNGRESIEQAKKVLPDIIIMDIMMPELDGIAAILKLRFIKETRSIPVIVCTAVKENEDEIVARSLGVAGYIRKASEMEGLVKKIEEVLSK